MKWLIKFCTSWDDEPPDTVLDVTWQATSDELDRSIEYPLIEAPDEKAAVQAFLDAISESRRQFYDDEGNVWAVLGAE